MQLLADWGLITINDVDKILNIAPLNQIKVLAFKKKMIGNLRPNIILVSAERCGNRINSFVLFVGTLSFEHPKEVVFVSLFFML